MSDAVLADLAALVSGRAGARERLERLDEQAAAHAIAVAREHGVEAWLVAAVSAGAVAVQGSAQRSRFIAARTRTRADLQKLGAVLDSVAPGWVVVKGQALAEDLYPRPHFRHAIDTDVLVAPADFESAVDTLIDSGWRLIDRNWPLLSQTHPGELRLRSPSGELLDLHWNLLNTPALRRRFPIETAGLLAGRRRLASGLPVLAPADQLAHLGIHGALSGANRLVWLLDAALAASAIEDWPAAQTRIRQLGAAGPTSLVLRRSWTWLGPSGPDLRAGIGWGLLCRVVDRLSPMAIDPHRPALSRAFARSVGRTTPRTLGEFAGHGAARLRGHDRQPAGLTDPDDVSSPLHPVENPDARRAYFAAVTATR